MAETTQDQARDILLILDKEKLLLSALAKTDVGGKLKTVPATPEHNNDFLRFDGSDNWLDAFAANFWSQAKDPTKFGLIKLSEQQLDDPLVKRAMRDIEQGRITANVAGTDSRYEARISFRQLDDGRVILQTHPLRQAPDLTRPFLGHNFSEDDKLNLMGPAGNMGRVVPLKTAGGWEDCFISIDKMTNQIVAAKVEGAFIADTYSGITLSDYEKEQLREGKAVAIEGMVSKSGKEFNATLQYNAERRGVEYIFPQSLRFEHGQELGKVRLTDRQVDDFNANKAIFVEHMVRKDGEVFSSYVKRDEVSGKIAYSRVNPDNPSEVFGVTLSALQRADLQDGKAVLIEGMKGNGGVVFSQWAKVNPGGNKLNYFNENPDIKRDATSRSVTQAASEKQERKKGQRL